MENDLYTAKALCNQFLVKGNVRDSSSTLYE